MMSGEYCISLSEPITKEGTKPWCVYITGNHCEYPKDDHWERHG